MVFQRAKIALPKELLDMDLSKAENAVARKMVGIAAPYVPKDTGKLAGSARAEGNRVIYTGAVPKLLYWGKRGGKKIHARAKGTQTHWFYGAKKDNLRLIQRYAAEQVKKELKIK